jgi:hypothetical protein
MPISFDDGPPYEPLCAISASSGPTRDGVVVTLIVTVDGLPTDTVPVQVLLEPEVARALATRLPMQADVVERWRQNQR